jgi:indolepyruvate decarboxylase
VDLDADRFGVAAEVTRLAEKIQAPVAVVPTAKATIDETHPHFAGLYNGAASEASTREAVENSDCLLSIGYRPIDLTTGDFTGSLPAGNGADIDYGPRGPQHRDKMLIRPAT